MADDKKSTFWGIKIWDNTGIYYYTEVNVSQDLEHNVPVESTVAYNSKYPFVTHNGIAFYYSGSCSGCFMENTGECIDDYNNDYRIDENGNYIYNVRFIDGFVKWLDNKKTKYIQLSEQLVIPANITSPIKWSTDTTIDDGHNCTISFDWAQAADDFSLDDTDYISECPYCKHMVSPFAKYCQICGKRLFDEKDVVYTGLYNVQGAEIKVKGKQYDSLADLNSALNGYAVDTTNYIDFNSPVVRKTFDNSILVYNQTQNFAYIYSTALARNLNTAIDASRVIYGWVDNLRTIQSEISRNINKTIPYQTELSLQWSSVKSSGTSLIVQVVANKDSATYGNITSGSRYYNNNKYVILSEPWSPYKL